jgi:Peptidase inhibitor I9.
MKGLFGLALLPLLAAASPMVVDSIHRDAAPIISSTTSQEVSDSYIVVFKKHVDPSAAAAHHSWVQDIHTTQGRTELKKRSLFGFESDAFLGMKHTFNVAGSLMGYAGHFHEDVIEQVRRHPDVSSSAYPVLPASTDDEAVTDFLCNRLSILRRTPLFTPWKLPR